MCLMPVQYWHPGSIFVFPVQTSPITWCCASFLSPPRNVPNECCCAGLVPGTLWSWQWLSHCQANLLSPAQLPWSVKQLGIGFLTIGFPCCNSFPGASITVTWPPHYQIQVNLFSCQRGHTQAYTYLSYMVIYRNNRLTMHILTQKPCVMKIIHLFLSGSLVQTKFGNVRVTIMWKIKNPTYI